MPIPANIRFDFSDVAGRLKRHMLIGSVALAASLFGAMSAQSATINLGEAQIQIDTTVSAGASVRASSRTCEHVALANGGCRGDGGKTTSLNSDNGNLNFGPGDLAQATVKVVSDVQGTWQNYGFFVRPTAFYDFVYARNNMDYKDLNKTARDELAHDVSILDAFVYGSWDVAGHNTTLRFGKQVLNWGESLYIPGGINQFQAVDVNKLRTPGSELKEALTPMPMVYASTAVSESVTLEAFWQFAYEQTQLDPAGSYWSTDDIVGKGSEPGYLNPLVGLKRTPDEGQNSTNQFGAAMHYYADQVGTGTDFGLYYVRYSSRLPYLSFRNSTISAATACLTVSGGTGTYNGNGICSSSGAPGSGNLSATAFGYAAGFATYYYKFPDSIDTLGASFSTTIGGTAVSGEASYTPKMPFAIESTVQQATLVDGLGASGLCGGLICTTEPLYKPGVGQSTQSIVFLNALQGQFGTVTSWTASDMIPSAAHADSAYFIVNVGGVYVPDANAYPLNRGGAEGGIPRAGTAALFSTTTNVQYATKLSTGYRMTLGTTYNNAFDLPVNLTPSVQWRHDVWGYSPGPITANFQQGTKAVTLGVDAEYQSWKANIGYTNYFGGGWSNALSDRDFASMSVSYAF